LVLLLSDPPAVRLRVAAPMDRVLPVARARFPPKVPLLLGISTHDAEAGLVPLEK
jgi:hypothetical protein